MTAPLEQRVAAHLAALKDHEAPLAYIDVDALERNAAKLLAQAAPLPVRVASKSLRCTELVLGLLARHEQMQGVMAFTIDEALHLAGRGVDDVLVAYPSVQAAALARLAEFQRAQPQVTLRLMVDDLAQATPIAAAARGAGTRIGVCVDVDASWRPFGARGPAIGPKRSPLRTPAQVAGLVRELCALPELRVDALMIYDGQIAGVGDKPPGRALRARAIRLMQRRSLSELHERVPRVIEAARREIEAADGSLDLVNVGGTGSLARIKSVGGTTEVTAGSGFYAPALFDTYRSLDLEPAAFFVLPVVRRPSGTVATVLGGGYVASGTATPDRLPSPVYPAGLRLDADEGAGEVQTPLLGRAAAGLAVGDRVVFRHAKAGELAERFDHLVLVRGGVAEGAVPTYRGEGLTFL